MVLVHGLAFVDASEYLLRHVELREADESLTEDQDVGDQTEDAVWVCEACLWVACFVHLDNNQAHNEEHRCDQVHGKVPVCAHDFLGLCACRLEDEDGLRKEQYTGRIYKL